MKKGFTLVELLAVVLIIGVLMGLGIPQYRKVIDRARVAEAESMMRALYDSSERLASDFGYRSFQDLQTAKGNISIRRFDMFDASRLPKGCVIDGSNPETLKCTRFWYRVNMRGADGKDYVVAKLVKGNHKDTYIMLRRDDTTLYCQASAASTDFCGMLGLDLVGSGFVF